MSCRLRFACLFLFAAGAQGCYLQGGASVGVAAQQRSRDEATWGGQINAAFMPGFLGAGVEVAGRAEHERGSLFSTGVQAILVSGDDNSSVRIEGHGDVGLALGWSAASVYYGGATLELPIRLEQPLPVTERNRNYRVLGSAPWLVPFVRYRFYDVSHSRDDVHDFAVGIALRVSYLSDWITL